MEYITALAITSSIGIMALAFTECSKNNIEKEVIYLSISMIVFYVFVFFIRHYETYLSRGVTGAMHGRYYYILIIPFFWLIFRNLDKYKEKFIVLLPIFLLCTSIYSELTIIFKSIEMWW